MLNNFKLKTLTLCFILMATSVGLAEANPIIPISANAPAPLPQVTPAAPILDAQAYILVDAFSGKVLAEKNPDVRLHPASLTKLMSLYIISTALKSGAIHLDDKVRISAKAWRTGGSRMFVKVGDEVPVKELMQGIIVASGNDATVAMAEYVAGTEEAFTSMMNTQAKALGMTNSHFTDSTGLPDPNHYSTARDFATLVRAITTNYPEDYRLFSEKWFTYNGIRQPNRNRLLWRFQYADGLKTGHTEEAGYCLISSALKNGMRLVSVVMGAPSDEARTEDSVRLLTYGFRFYETHKVYSAGNPLTTARVWKGENPEVPFGINSDFYVTLPAGQYNNVHPVVTMNGTLQAPIVKGQTYGTLAITLNNQVLASKPLVALADNPTGGVWRRFSDAVSYHLNGFFNKKSG